MKIKLSLLITSLLLISFIGFGQTQQQVDSVNKMQAAWDKERDSIISTVSLKQFNDYLDVTITSKFFREGTFGQLLEYYLQRRYEMWVPSWIQAYRKQKPK